MGTSEGWISVKLCSGQLTASVMAIILFLFITGLQCHCFLADTGTLQEEIGNSCKNSMLGAARDVGSESIKISSPPNRRADLEKRIVRTSTVTSSRGLNTRSQLQVEALNAFKAAITDDPLGTLKSWRANDVDSCSWVGVECSLQHPTLLIALDLAGAKLAGDLNSALQKVGHLRFLRRLDLSNNVFSGSIPAASLVNCSELLYLNVSSNQLSGEIPSELEKIVSLQTLDFAGNNLTGQIPLSLGNSSFLRVLNLSSNLLEGAIPPVLGRLSDLTFLDLSENSLSGSIPPALGNCSSLTYMDFSYNSNLAGELPPDLGLLKSLQIFTVSFCNFQGTVPTWLGNLTALRQFDGEHNQFHGVIPDVIGQPGNILSLIFRSNSLTGAFPISITNYTALSWLGLQYNNFTGKIPPEVGLLRNVEHLLLAGNSFTGVIPSSIANCSALTGLSLGFNQLDPQIIPPWILSLTSLKTLYFDRMNLQGGIPADIGRLSNLQDLELGGNNLSGVIPSTLANCTFLRILDLEYNKFTGEIPSELGLLQNVTWFVVGENFLSGSFPSFLENFTQIGWVDLGNNSLSGTIDINFGRLSQLQRFTASFNSFSGPIPETLSNCSSLYLLNFFVNELSGSIPPSWGNMTSIGEVDLGYNSIEGTIPIDLMRCSTLIYLDLKENYLEGSLPSNIGQLSSLQQLYLIHNNFTGTLPTSLGNCSDMIILDLSYNQFTGSIPGNTISQMSASLTSLNVSHNLFSGSWPAQLSELANIQFIDVSSNNISGSFPESLGSSWTVLSRLDVSINNLTGAIPQYMGQLGSLAFFNASYNSFQGPLPDSHAFEEKFTEASFLANPGLCGIILGLEQKCPVRNNGASHKPCEGFKCKRVWIPITCAVVAVALIVAGSLGWLYIIPKGTEKRENIVHPTYMLAFASDLRFTEQDVLRIIEGNRNNIIGVGANSVVLKGVLAGGETVAIKLLQKFEDSSGSENELVEEVRTMAQLRHRNVLKVLSFYSNMHITAIILECVSEGSLHKHLHELPDDSGSGQLTWPRRFNIAVGVAEAMVYLHHDFPEPLIHRDLKPSNILLDANWDPKVADFGLSKFVNPSRDGEATASMVCGTFGYMPPEYGTGTQVSTKGDIYSYGVVLLELLTSKHPASSVVNSFGPDQDLRGWVMESFQTRPFELLDATLRQEGVLNFEEKQQMLLLMRVALFCTKENPQNRPNAKEVFNMLTQIKEVGLLPTTRRTVGDLANEEGSTYESAWMTHTPT